MKCSGSLWTLSNSNFLERITELIVHMCVAVVARLIGIMPPSCPKREFRLNIFLTFVAVLTTLLCRRFGYIPLILSPFAIGAVLTFAVNVYSPP